MKNRITEDGGDNASTHPRRVQPQGLGECHQLGEDTQQELVVERHHDQDPHTFICGVGTDSPQSPPPLLYDSTSNLVEDRFGTQGPPPGTRAKQLSRPQEVARGSSPEKVAMSKHLKDGRHLKDH